MVQFNGVLELFLTFKHSWRDKHTTRSQKLSSQSWKQALRAVLADLILEQISMLMLCHGFGIH